VVNVLFHQTQGVSWILSFVVVTVVAITIVSLSMSALQPNLDGWFAPRMIACAIRNGFIITISGVMTFAIVVQYKKSSGVVANMQAVIGTLQPPKSDPSRHIDKLKQADPLVSRSIDNTVNAAQKVIDGTHYGV